MDGVNTSRTYQGMAEVVEKEDKVYTVEYTTQAWAVVPPGKTALVVWEIVVWKKSDDCPREREYGREVGREVREENRERK